MKLNQGLDWEAKARRQDCLHYLIPRKARSQQLRLAKVPHHRLKSVLLKGEGLGRKRTAATATARGVGIYENEALPHECFVVLERGSVEVQQAFWVNEDSGIFRGALGDVDLRTCW